MNLYRILVLLGLLIIILPAQAMLPTTVNYQGHLSNNQGIGIDATHNITFRLYTTASGASLVWNETQTVDINQGLFQVELGTVTPFKLPIDFNQGLYLGIEVENDGEMTPRRKLSLSPYSIKAMDAETVGGFSAVELDQSAHLYEFSNPHQVSATQIGAATVEDITSHAADDSAHHAPYTDTNAVSAIKAADGAGSNLDADLLDGQHANAFASVSQVSSNTTTIASLQATISTQNAEIAALQATIGSLSTSTGNLNNQVAELIDRLKHYKRLGNDVVLFGANLYVQSGVPTGVLNSLGNIVVGYNGSRGFSGGYDLHCSLGEYLDQNSCENADGIWARNHKIGSHNIIIGDEHNYSSYGGLVAGNGNTISRKFASVIGGRKNTASGIGSSISGGQNNTASGPYSSVSGGDVNIASGNSSSVSGGVINIASNIGSSVSGGERNVADGLVSSVSGGLRNKSSGESSSISGGSENRVSGNFSSISGGWSNSILGLYSSVSGGSSNKANGEYSSVSGGFENSSSGLFTSVSGGRKNLTLGSYSSVSGGYNNYTRHYYSSASGGYNIWTQSDFYWAGGKYSSP